MKTLGSIRSVNCAEAEIVLASGIYLTFRIDVAKTELRHLVEVSRRRAHQRARQSVLVDAHTLLLTRQSALQAILTHRRAMYLRATPLQSERLTQLQFAY